MSTRRERLERKLAKRTAWASSRRSEAERRLSSARKMADGIPFGQPILVGHHSEKRDRRFRDRISGNFEKSYEADQMAAHHESKAAGLAAQLESTIFSDDRDAIESLEARITENEAKRDRMTTINRLYRKNDAAGLAALGLDLARLQAQVAAVGLSFVKAPYEGYQLSNLGARIRSDKQRVEDIRRRQAQSVKAEAAPLGVLVEEGSGWCRVTFAEKPARQILNDLRAAGFRWGAGYWAGLAGSLPASVRSMAGENMESAP